MLEHDRTLAQIARGLTWIGTVFVIASAAVIVLDIEDSPIAPCGPSRLAGLQAGGAVASRHSSSDGVVRRAN